MYLIELVEYLDGLLGISEIKDTACNGLQVEGPEEVSKLAFAVDACRASIEEAAVRGAQLLVTHHGLLWKDVQPIVDIHYGRIRALLDGSLGLYAVHLPLDCHPQLGNNAKLAAILEMANDGPFGLYEGAMIGIIGRYPDGLHRDELVERIESALETPSLLFPFGPECTRRIGIVSGCGGSLIADSAKCGCDTFVTGEHEHAIYHAALEHGINVVLAGHYATEKVGVLALQEHLRSEFDLETTFIDLPTGL